VILREQQERGYKAQTHDSAKAQEDSVHYFIVDSIGMRRLHLFEFGDQPWFPRLLRDVETAYLATAYRFIGLSRLWAEKILAVLAAGEPAEFLDLCSGSGGPMPLILDELAARGYKAHATLTDLYPNPKSAPHPRVTWLKEPVDATQVAPNLAGVRTMFSAFHHFRPLRAKAILADAFNKRRAICIFESGLGSLRAAFVTLLIPVNVLLLMPFARPFRWSYFAFTYLIPIMPLIIFSDGIVSALRIYSPEQMQELTKDLQAADYAWEIGRIRARGIPDGLPYLIGMPSR